MKFECIPVQFSSVVQSCLTETPWTAAHQASLSFTIFQSLLKFISIESSHPLSSPSPPAFNLSQHQGLFQCVNSSHQVAKVLELQLQHHSFQWIFRVDFLKDWLVWSPCSPRDSQESSPEDHSWKASILRHSAFFMVQLSHSIHDYWKSYSFDYTDLCWQSDVSMECYSIRKRNELSSHEKTWRNFKCILTRERSWFEKATYCMIPTLWHSGKGKLWRQKKDQEFSGL